jgi:hypothetical protein
MLDIQDIMDVTFNELSTEQQLHLKEAIEQFQQKCLMSFSKNRSGVPFLKSEMPRVRVCLVHVYGPNQAHGVQQPRVWLPASTLEPGSRAAIPPLRRRLHPELRPNPPFLQSQARALQARAMAPEIFGCARAGERRGGGRGKARVTAPSSRHSSLL